MNTSHFPRRAAIALAGALLAAPAWSQAPAQPGASAQQTEARQLMQEYRQVAGQLRTIQQETIKANPDLAERHEAYQAMVNETMIEDGHSPKATRAELEQIRDKVSAGDVEQEERKALRTRFQSKRQELAQARQQAMNNPEVREAGESLRTATIAAMKDHDSETTTLISRMQDIQQQMQQLQQGAG